MQARRAPRTPTRRTPTLLDDFGSPDRARARDHLFGVDQLGRDVFRASLYGARVSLEVAFIATGLVVLIGVDRSA